MKDSNAPEDKVFDFKFTKGEIAIIKAGLQYFWLDDDFGYALWGTMPYATFGSGDSEYRVRVDETYKKLKQVSKVKPDYGWWGNIKRLKKLCQSEYKKAKKEGEDAEERMFEHAVYSESIQNGLDKLGLNGTEILGKVTKACKEKLELERKKLKKIK